MSRMCGSAGDPAHRERLARISHHFLSEGPLPAAAKGKLFAMAILERGADDDGFPAVALAQALLKCGVETMLFAAPGAVSLTCDIPFYYSSMGRFRFPEDGGRNPDETPLEHLLAEGASVFHRPDLVLITLTSPMSPYLGLCGRVLIPARASPDGIRDAYGQIKRIALQEKPVEVGVTITGVSGQATAQRYFNQLAVAAHRFLDLRLLSYGFLGSSSEDQFSWGMAATAEHDTLPPGGMDDIAALIHHDWGKWHGSRGSGPQRGGRSVTSVEDR